MTGPHWNLELGLCRQEEAGHTADVAGHSFVHNGVQTAVQLCALAQQNRLDDALLRRALRTLRTMQVTTPGDRFGCLKWYWEEQEIRDTNAAFFIGLSLQVLYLAEGCRLSEAARAGIREIVQDLAVWFEHELADAHPRYPNKCMGDLVCSWLGAEVLGRAPSEQLLRTTREWCDYWRSSHWGWGEHLSDVYAMVLLMELSAVLLFSPSLPASLRCEFKAKFDELLAIEDAYGGDPRVPAIRSYAFADPPRARPFRSFVQPAPAADQPNQAAHPAVIVTDQATVLGQWFHRAGWHRLALPARPVQPWVETACHDGAVARAVVRPTIRLGAMSHYPVMAHVDHQLWGLSWQTFPAALWRPAGDWGFWRWITREGDRVRGHPALDKHSAYLGNALATELEPPPVPRMTSTLTPEGHLTMARVLPIPSGDRWDEVCDGFWLLQSKAEVVVTGTRLRLRWPDGVVWVQWRGAGVPTWEPQAGGGRWQVVYDRADLAGREVLTHRWELTLESNRG